MRSDFATMLVFGKNWTTRFAVVRKNIGKVSIKLEQGLRHMIAEGDQVNQSNRRTKGNSAMLEIILKIANLVCCKMLHLSDHVRVCSSAKKQIAVSHGSAESEIHSLDGGLRTDGVPAFDFRECVLETFSVNQPRETLLPCLRERVILSFSFAF